MPPDLLSYFVTFQLLDGQKHKALYKKNGEEIEYTFHLKYRTYEPVTEPWRKPLPPAVVEIEFMSDKGGMSLIFVKGFVYMSVIFKPLEDDDEDALIPFENHNSQQLKAQTPALTRNLINYFQHAKLITDDIEQKNELEFENEFGIDHNDIQEVSDAFIKMEEINSSTLIAGLMRGNAKQIEQAIMQSQFLKNTFDSSDLGLLIKYLIKNVSSVSWLKNSYIQTLITSMINQHSNFKTSERILQGALQRIPDNEISVRRKAEIAIDIMGSEGELIHDLTYVEIPNALPLNKSQASKDQNRDIESAFEKYRTAIQPLTLDMSEFILLTVKLIAPYLPDNHDTQHHLNSIRYSYWKLDYETALNTIKTLVENQHSALGNELSRAIIDKIPHLNEINTTENHSRRFYENRIAQFYSGSYLDYDSINKITRFFHHKKVENVKEVETAIISLAEMGSIDSTILAADNNFRKLIKLKSDRNHKQGFTHKTEEAKGARSEQVYSRNMGVLTSLSPNFYDERSEEDLKNRVVDKSRAAFFSNKKREAFVAGYAGHSFCISATLRKYILANVADESLQKDINAFLKAYMAIYAARGYHSLKEMELPFLEENNILNSKSVTGGSLFELFASNNIKLDFSFPEDVLNKAFADAAIYTESICLKKAAHKELFSLENNKVTIDKQKTEFESLASILHARIMHFMAQLEQYAKNHPDEDIKHLQSAFVQPIYRYNDLIEKYFKNKNSFYPSMLSEVRAIRDEFNFKLHQEYASQRVPLLFQTFLPLSPVLPLLKNALPDSKEVQNIQETIANSQSAVTLQKIVIDPELFEAAKNRSLKKK